MRYLGFVLAVGTIAVLCLSSATLAAIVGVLTAAVVAIDMLALAPRRRGPPSAHRDKLSVDLSRRQ